MSIESIKNGVIAGAKYAFEGIKTAAIWLGRKIVHLLQFLKETGLPALKRGALYLASLVASLWRASLPYLKAFVSFLATGYGVAGLAIAAAFVVHKLGEKYFPGEENKNMRAVINGIAAVLLVSAGAIGISFGAIPVI